jgi:hypothetical protein
VLNTRGRRSADATGELGSISSALVIPDSLAADGKRWDPGSPRTLAMPLPAYRAAGYTRIAPVRGAVYAPEETKL